MDTNKISNTSQTIQNAQQPIKQEKLSVVEMVKILQSVDTTSKEAKLNASTISDGKDGRIELSQDLTGQNDFEK